MVAEYIAVQIDDAVHWVSSKLAAGLMVVVLGTAGALSRHRRAGGWSAHELPSDLWLVMALRDSWRASWRCPPSSSFPSFPDNRQVARRSTSPCPCASASWVAWSSASSSSWPLNKRHRGQTLDNRHWETLKALSRAFKARQNSRCLLCRRLRPTYPNVLATARARSEDNGNYCQ